MKISILSLTFVGLTTLISPSLSAAHLFILSGQSNMARLDPSLSFTPTVTAALSPEEAIVVHHAEGGQPIWRWYHDWEPYPGTNITYSKPKGELYDQLMAMVNTAIAGKTIETITFVWAQGEQDAKNKKNNYLIYEDSFLGLMGQLEADLGRTDIHCVVSRLCDHNPGENTIPLSGLTALEQWNWMRQMQVRMASERAYWDWINTDDLNDVDDKLHYTDDGYVTMGERLAESALRLIGEKQGLLPSHITPPVLNSQVSAGGSIQLNWQTPPVDRNDRIYQVLYSTNLRDWQLAPSGRIAAGSEGDPHHYEWTQTLSANERIFLQLELMEPWH